jgi:S-adenosylmethionine:tRNA ribosyltransferase-isomerase
VQFHGSPADIWAGIARHGRPVQYSHIGVPLRLWDVWTAIAGAPVAFEPPSAAFLLDARLLGELRHRGVRLATLTHAAGLSSTGDPDLDARLPLDERYTIPARTARLVKAARRRGRRVVALGTTVVRALEHSALVHGRVRAGTAWATQRIGAATTLRVVDAIISGTHEPGTSHYELLRAFAADETLRRAARELDARGYRTHEFGDSVLIAASRARRRQLSAATRRRRVLTCSQICSCSSRVSLSASPMLESFR